MTDNEFYTKININPQALKYASQTFVPDADIRLLTEIDTAPSAYQKIIAMCKNDGTGLKMLSCMLKAARYTYEKYRNLGISDDIFIDTLSCFTRFSDEYRASFGEYGFDRGWWAYRHLSCVLFKVGELEYEYRDDEKTVHLHIPTSAHIEIDNCKRSLDNFIVFTEKHFPPRLYPIVCNSWLLSPALDELLPANSKILSFKRCFKITEWDKTQLEFIKWIFGKQYMDFNDLPEKTSLQKRVKDRLLHGGFIGSARGQLIDFVKQ